MKLRATILVGLLLLQASPAVLARGGGGGGHGGGGGGHGGGGGGHGGGGGGYHGGGGYGGIGGHAGGELGYSGGHTGGWGNGGGWGNNHGGYGYGGYGYGYGGYGGYGYAGNPYDNSYTGAGFGNAPAVGDPLADYYRQQAQASAAAQAQANVSAVPMGFGTGFMPVNTSIQNSTVTEASRVDIGNDVRDNFHGSGLFAPSWWKNYKNAWCNSSWPSDWVWLNVDWDTLANFWGVSSAKPPGDYEFGDNVKYQNEVVYFGDQPTAKAADFYRIAQTLAAKGVVKVVPGTKSPPPSTADWQPLGIFSLVHPTQKFSTTLFQLAVNKQGLVRGNCYNVLTGQLDTIHGAADKTNSRLAFTVGNNRSVIYDSGVGNLLNAQSPILVHMSKDQREQMTMVRLRQAKI
jgi:hypothetical protein